MSSRISTILLFACSVLSASDFQDYQAARAVIGQPAFSAHGPGITARSLSLAKGSLYVADTSGHVLTYDLSRLASSKTTACPVCLTAPQFTTTQTVFEGVASVAVNGRRIAIIDAKSHSVLIWNGISSLEPPDVVLSGFINPTSVALDNHRLFVGDAATHHVFVWNALPSSSSQPPDATLGVSEPADGPGADTIQTPSALASDGENLYVADAAVHRVLVFAAADSPPPQPVNAATLMSGPFAPGTLILIDHVLNTRVSVFLNGTFIPIAETNGDQLQVQIPYELNNATAGVLWLKSELADGSTSTSRSGALRFTTVSPGIFAFGSKDPRTGLLLHSPAGVPLSPEDPAKPSELLTVWATGLGAVTLEANADGAFVTLIPVRATIGGNPVEVISAVLPAEATGVYEVHLRLPSQLSPGAPLILFQNDSRSNAVTFPTAN